MSENKAERQIEQQRVDRVIRIIRDKIDALSGQISDAKAHVIEIRKHFWDDVTVNTDNFDELVETHFSVKQQAELLSERERSLRHSERQLAILERLVQSPYFGRIDFRERGEPAAESVYLGIASLMDEQGEHFLIYDWRAPISSLYYDYGLGPARYETPSGVIEGEVELKRQFVIRDGNIQYMFDTGLTIGDELLQQVLGQGADTHMKTIVATIQREQNRIIRNDDKRLLIVTGPAGSGKTSAALQRVAYLLYKYRKTLRADQIVLFSPNPLFNRYVSTVLPELGEENMEQTTFHEYLEHRLADRFQLEDPYTQIEYLLTADDDPDYAARVQSVTFKTSTAFLEVIRRYAESLKQRGLAFKDIKLRGQILISAEQIAEKFYSLDAVSKLTARFSKLAEWLDREIGPAVMAERDKPWVDEEIEQLGQEDFRRVQKTLRKERRSGQIAFNERHREDDLLRELVMQRHLRRLRARIKRLKFVDVAATYRKLFADPNMASSLIEPKHLPPLWPRVCSLTVERLDRGELLYEDAAPFLYLQEMIEGFRANMNVRHVLIDEAQDYSPFQFEFLKKLFPLSRMTVLGDPNQIVHAHGAVTGFESIADLFGPGTAETIHLTRTYRSTRPIVEFTRSMLPDGDRIEPFNRDGEMPTVTAAADSSDLHEKIADRLRALQNEPFKTIAVICKTAQESAEAFEALRERVNAPLHLITKETVSFETGIVVIPSYLAKGIEFDAVIVYDGSRAKYGKETERKLFYTVCTRAMHRLYIYHVGAMSPFIEEADRSTYNIT